MGSVGAYLAGVLYRSTRAAAFSPLTPRTCISCRAKTSLTDWAWGQGRTVLGVVWGWTTLRRIWVEAVPCF